MALIKTPEEIGLIKQSSLLVGKTLAEVARHLRPGVTTRELDRIAEQFIRDHGAIPGFKGYHGYPAALCISVNSVVVHGIPNDYAIKEGDIVSVDCGVVLNGFWGDSAYTFAVGEIAPEVQMLLKHTLESLYKGIEAAVAGNRIGDIGHAVQSHVEQFGYGVVRDLVGHGLGRQLHEKPDVPNFGRKGTGPMLHEGMILAIEPMINLGTPHVVMDKDGWTIRTRDGKPSAHFEHDIVVRKGKAEILSTFSYIEEVLQSKL
ncbi:MAG: type I methionyl aminopeptidase [Bacteroidales bacterium]|jgi:methionyl aminopeptidase|nr:type I methionyl aminopeptidase [Bacteroidales bacterium]NPV36706.1 type I methionyl aminopeptidase [Bacteroidales bacterium]